MNGNDSLDPVPEQEMKTIQGGAVDVVEVQYRDGKGVNISIPDEEAIFRGPSSNVDVSVDASTNVAVVVKVET